VRQNGEALVHVPYEQRTVALCTAAVKQTRWAIFLVPMELKDAVERELQAAPAAGASTPMGQEACDA
jgi:hypothetical protein